MTLGSNPRLSHILTSSRRAHLHPVNTLLALTNPPQLILLSTRQPHICPSLRPVPASLTIFKPQYHPRPLTQALSIHAILLIGNFGSDPLKVAHIGVAMALLALLGRAIEPAQLVLVLAHVGADALALECAEDVVGPVVLGQVALLVGELRRLGGVLGAGGLERVARGLD